MKGELVGMDIRIELSNIKHIISSAQSEVKLLGSYYADAALELAIKNIDKLLGEVHNEHGFQDSSSGQSEDSSKSGIRFF